MAGTSELNEKLEQREAEIAVINSVQEGIIAKKEVQEIYEMVGDRLKELFDAQVTGIYTFDYEKGLEHFQYLFEDGERLYPEARPLNLLRKWIINHKDILLINEDADVTVEKITGEIHEPVPGTRLPKSLIFVPLIVNDQVKGCLSLQNLDREHAFSDSDVKLLHTLSKSISIALENARLFNETEQRNAELAVINSVQQGLVAEMDMQSIYDLVGDRIRDLFDAQVAIICTFDHESSKEHFQYQYEDGERLYPAPRALDNFRRRLIKTKEMILINENFPDRAEEILGIKPEAVPGTDLPQSVLFVPLIIGDSVRGYVSLQNLDHEQAFPESDVRLLSTLANSMSVALENARLFNETEQRNAELAVINSVQQGLVAEMNLQGIYDLVGDRIRNLFDAQSVIISTFDYKKSEELFQYNYENGERFYPKTRPIDSFRKNLIETKDLLLINDHFPEKAEEILGFKPEAVPGTHLPKSALFVPLIIGDEVRGYVSLQNIDIEFAFSDSDVRLLSTLANSMSVALENARLFNETTRLLAETEQRNAELAVINSVQDGLVREMDMEAIYKLVGERICDVLDTQTMIIRTFDHEKGLEYWQYAIENGKRIEVEPRPFIWANKKLIETKKHLLINEDYEKIATKYEGTAVTKGLAPKSAIFVPMIVGDTVMGSVSLQNVLEEHAFNESDLQLITTLTNSMSVAIENARLFNETEQRAAEMQTVNNISRALVSQLEFDKLIELVGEQMRETFKADIVYLALHDRKTNMLNFPYYYGDNAEPRPFGNGITEKIILKKEPILINQNLDDAYHRLKAEKKGKMVESYLGVPIMAGDISIGVISVQSKEQENRFNENDLRLLTTIAANVGVAMQNAESYEKLRSALKDLKAAQTQLVQQEKLASLGQLTAGIAHEIKNPLNFVNNFSELSVELIEEAREEVRRMAGDQGPVSEKAGVKHEREESPLEGGKDAEPSPQADLLLDILGDIELNLKKINEHGTRADSIVKSMLQHSRGGDGKLELTPLNPIIKEYVNLSFHGMRAGKNPINVDIDLQLDESIGEVLLIGEDFSRVILNLCNNAFDAMRDKAKVKSEKSEAFMPKLTVRTHQKDKTVTIEIEDNGPGIPEEMKDKILQPFFTTKKGTDGTGLGLSITNDIVKAHGGELKINSIPEKGTTFSIILMHN
jgi:GAF domain-containing protein